MATSFKSITGMRQHGSRKGWHSRAKDQKEGQCGLGVTRLVIGDQH